MKKKYYKKYRLLRLWQGIKDRCYNEKSVSYRYYGFKGITVCNEWQNYTVFKEWALNNGYIDKKTIHRKDKSKSYSPENCVWISKRKHTKIHSAPSDKKSWSLSIQEKEKALMDYSEQNNIDINTLKLKENIKLRFVAYKIYRQNNVLEVTKWEEEFRKEFKKIS